MATAAKCNLDLTFQWRRIKRLSAPERLLWLQTTPGVEIHFGDSLPVMIAKACRQVEKARVKIGGRLAWEDDRTYHDLTTACLCDSCRSKRRWPSYYTQTVRKREICESSRGGYSVRITRECVGSISYECLLESMPPVEEGVPQIPGSVGIIGGGY